ncbi:MAG TPA: DinB family protein [Mucilaginibacter sp.]
MNALTETWQIHNRINLYLLDSIDEANLGDISASKGRTVGEQFAHIHNVRLMWLKVADPAALETVTKIEKERIDKDILKIALTASGEVIAQLFERSFADGKIKGFKPHAAGFLGYLISHESHHRGQIMLSLKQSGHPVDKKIQFGLWEWGTR